MNKIWHTHLFRATLSFTLAVIFSALYNLTTSHSHGDYLFFLELFGLIVCLEIIDYALGYIPFSSRIIYLFTEFGLMYICFLLFSLLGHWFGFTFIKVLFFSITFLAIFLLLHLYDHFLLKTQASEINDHLIRK